MTTSQIAVRLPSELVAHLDQRVRDGHARSRAEIVLQALLREVRREEAERDAAILAAQSDGDFDGLAAYAAKVDMSDLD